MIGEMTVLDQTGHTTISWDSDNPDEVEAARLAFERLTGAGHMLAFEVGEGGRTGEQMTAFDPAAEEVILLPPMQGG